MIKLKKEELKVFIFTIAFKLLIDILYMAYIAHIYHYRQLFLEFNLNKYTLSWILTVLVFFMLPLSEYKTSYFVLQFHYYIMIVPFLSIWGLKNESTLFTMMLIICFTIEIYALRSKFTFKIPLVKNGRYILWTLLLFLTIYTYGFLMLYNTPTLLAIDFSKIYVIRANVKYANTFLRYTTIWQFRCINPYFIIYGIQTKNKKLTFVFSILQILMYFIVARKEVIFSIVLILGMSYMLKKVGFAYIFSLGLCGLSVLVWGIYVLTGNLVPLALFPTRFLIDPAVIKFQFYEVFSYHLPKLLYSESIIGRIFGIEYPYNRASGYIVNAHYNSFDSMANTGYLAYGYANMGFLGMIIISILFIFLMKIIDSSVVNVKVAFAFLAYIIMGLNDGDLLVCLLTGGLLLFIVILILDNEIFGKEIQKNSS